MTALCTMPKGALKAAFFFPFVCVRRVAAKQRRGIFQESISVPQ